MNNEMNNEIFEINALFTPYEELMKYVEENGKEALNVFQFYPEYALHNGKEESLLKSYNFIDFHLTRYLKKEIELSDDFLKKCFIYKTKISKKLEGID